MIAEGPVLESYLWPYVPAGIYLLLIIATAIAMMNASRLLGPRRPSPQKETAIAEKVWLSFCQSRKLG